MSKSPLFADHRRAPAKRSPFTLEPLEARQLLSTVTLVNVQVSYGTAYDPVASAVGDVNNDGVPDILVACDVGLTTGDVSVLLGKGDGTFNTKIDAATDIRPRVLALGDLNGDGLPDLAASNEDNGTVDVLLNQGNGQFAAPADYTAAGSSSDLKIADFNGDGHPDIVTANIEDQSLSLFLNHGNGTFGAAERYSSLDEVGPIAVGDINGDGLPDIVAVGDNASQIQILYGNASGDISQQQQTFATQDTFHNGVALGDFNGDGHLDIATTGYDPVTSLDRIETFLGPTFGTSVPTGTFDTPVADVGLYAADFNQDGHVDLLAQNVNNETVVQGDGTGAIGAPSFAEDHIFAGSNVHGLTIADINGDNYPDLVNAYNEFGQNVGVFTNVLGNGGGYSGGGGGGGGGGGTTTAGTLTPVVAKDTVPASIVSGAKVKAAVSLLITNTASTATTGGNSVSLYASTTSTVDSTAQPLATFSKGLKLKSGKTARVNLAIKSLPTTAGTYTLIAETVDASGNKVDAVVGSTTVGPATVTLTPTFTAGALTHNGVAIVTLVITNSGNTTPSGMSTVNFYASNDNTPGGALLIGKHLNLPIKPGKSKTLKFHFTAAQVTTLNAYSTLVAEVIDPLGKSQTTSSTGV